MANLFSTWAVALICIVVTAFGAKRLERKRCTNLLRRRVAYTNPSGKFTLLQAIQEINNG